MLNDHVILKTHIFRGLCTWKIELAIWATSDDLGTRPDRILLAIASGRVHLTSADLFFSVAQR